MSFYARKVSGENQKVIYASDSASNFARKSVLRLLMTALRSSRVCLALFHLFLVTFFSGFLL